MMAESELRILDERFTKRINEATRKITGRQTTTERKEENATTTTTTTTTMERNPLLTRHLQRRRPRLI